MTVQLEVGMTAMRYDGERVGPVKWRDDAVSFRVGSIHYSLNGRCYDDGDCPYDLVAAGYPWAELGAQVGDTVGCVWSSYNKTLWENEFIVSSDYASGPMHPDSLYVIAKTAAKPANRPRAAHKLDLQTGDRVRLDAWQDGTSDYRGNVYEKRSGRLTNVDDPHDFWNLPLTDIPKGERPLFTVLPREDARQGPPHIYTGDDGSWNCDLPHIKPDDVIETWGCFMITKGKWAFTVQQNSHSTHRFTLTFPHGSDTGTVVKETL